MKKVIYYSIVLLCSGLFACSESKQAGDELEVIPIEAAFANPSELKASEYFQKVRYVRLETSDSCLIGANPTVRISGDKLIVNSGRKQCYAFDKKTGRFISSLGHIGNDPQGAFNLDGWINDASGRIYFIAGDNKFVEYDLEGNCLEYTSEQISLIISSMYIERGGSRIYPASARITGGEIMDGYGDSFRLVLYII